MRLKVLAALALLGAHAPVDKGAVFDAAWRTVAHDYWDRRMRGVDWEAARATWRPRAVAAPDSETLYADINAMLGLLHDSHVFATPPAEVRYEAAADSGTAEASFGFASYDEQGAWLVYEVVPGSSAAQAGVRPGWTLLSIDGRAVDIDRHPAAGEKARLAFRDEAGRPRMLDLVAALEPPEPSVRPRRLPGDMLLIDIDGFDAHEDREIAAALQDGPPPAAVILDLRDNDGGEEQTAARTAGLFFARTRPLLLRIDRRRAVPVPIEGAGPRSYAGPVAVLVGPRTASAAEALAALFAESGRGLTIGARTAGALTGATLDDLPDGGQLSVAMYDVRTPGGARIEGRGFVPQHVVPETPASLAAGEDRPLAEALRLLAPSLLARQPLHARP